MTETAHHPKLRLIHAYWNGKRGSRLMPARADIDPVEIPDLLPHLTLIDVHRGPLRFSYRLAGTAVVDFLGHEVAGLDVSEALPPEIADVTLPECRRCAEEGVPVWGTFDVRMGGYRTIRIHRVLLPLSDDGQTVNMLLACIHIVDPMQADVAETDAETETPTARPAAGPPRDESGAGIHMSPVP